MRAGLLPPRRVDYANGRQANNNPEQESDRQPIENFVDRGARVKQYYRERPGGEQKRSQRPSRHEVFGLVVTQAGDYGISLSVMLSAAMSMVTPACLDR